MLQTVLTFEHQWFFGDGYGVTSCGSGWSIGPWVGGRLWKTSAYSSAGPSDVQQHFRVRNSPAQPHVTCAYTMAAKAVMQKCRPASEFENLHWELCPASNFVP